MANIGYSGSTFNSFYDTAGQPRIVFGNRITLPASQRLKSIWYRSHTGQGSNTAEVEVGLYDVTGLNSGTIGSATRLLTKTITLSPSASAQWIGISGFSDDLSAHAGKEVAIAIATKSTGNYTIQYNSTGTSGDMNRLSATNAALPATWGGSLNITGYIGLYAETETTGMSPHTRNTTITVNPATPVGSQTMTVNYSDGSSATRALTVVRPIQVQFNSASGTLLVLGNGSNYTGTLDKYTVWDKDPRHDATAAVVLTGTNLSVTAGVAAIGAYGDPLVNGTTYWVVVSENDDSLYALAPLVAG